MIFFKKKVPSTVRANELRAERLKAQIIAKPHQLEKQAQRLNELLLADGITLKILYATGGDRRGKSHG